VDAGSIEKIASNIISAGIGSLATYFFKMQGFEGRLSAKCDVEQVKEIVDKRIDEKMEIITIKLDYMEKVNKSIARQVGAEIPE